MKRRKQQKQANSPVVSTSHVTFDENLLTFYLYAGSSLYAFCITPELNLEHLYWGPRLPKGYDLRFISANTRSLVFNTLEASGIHDFSSMGLSGDDFNSPDLLLPDADTSVTRVASDASTENLFRSMDSRALAKVSHHTSSTRAIRSNCPCLLHLFLQLISTRQGRTNFPTNLSLNQHSPFLLLFFRSSKTPNFQTTLTCGAAGTLPGVPLDSAW
jgi:hypothetical protein